MHSFVEFLQSRRLEQFSTSRIAKKSNEIYLESFDSYSSEFHEIKYSSRTWLYPLLHAQMDRFYLCSLINKYVQCSHWDLLFPWYFQNRILSSFQNQDNNKNSLQNHLIKKIETGYIQLNWVLLREYQLNLPSTNTFIFWNLIELIHNWSLCT